MHLEAREERQNLFCLTSVLHLRTDNTYADRPSSPSAYLRPFAERPSPPSGYLRPFADHSRSFSFPKRRTRIAVNGPQMRVDDAMVCVRGAPRSPRGTTEPVLSYICGQIIHTRTGRRLQADIYDHSRTIHGHLRSQRDVIHHRNLFGTYSDAPSSSV